MSTEFKQSIADALRNPTLTGALGRFSESYRITRAKTYEGIDFEALRTRIAEVKSHAASHLEALAEAFQKNAEARGAKVFRTSDPEQVREYVLQVARAQGARAVVKSKSMASEELHLNAHLVKEGLEVKETDLGEWIVQLAGQRPSHMVLPAIHMTKEEVAELFSKEVNERLTSDIPRLVSVAREQLRQKFLAADIGISGANIAVAETGSLVLFTNEGNARLVTSLPKTHIAIVGIEKLVEHMDDVFPIMTALPRSATSQLLTSYVSVIGGSTPNTDGSLKDLHIILMDNRRTEMAADPKFREALQCIRCGSCLNVCPVFRLLGGHVFGKVYTGGIGTILTAWFDALKQAGDIQTLCIQCNTCKDFCPGKIDIPALIMELRRRLAVESGQPLVAKAIFSVVNNRRLFHSMLRAAWLGQQPFSRGGYIRHLPLFLSEYTKDRSLPAIARVPFRDRIKKIRQPKGSEKAAFYAGCLIDFAYPEMGEAVVKILNRAGIEVVFPDAQTCCGAPARYSGDYETAGNNAIDNIRALAAEDVRYIVSACPTCTAALKHEFASTLESTGRRDWLPQAEKVASKTVDFSCLVEQLASEGRVAFRAADPAAARLTYHDSCHLKRTLHAEEQPRRLLRQSGHEIVEMFESDVCCGMGGSYSLKLPEISASILERKLTNIQATGAPMLAADCPGCVMQIRGGCDKQGLGISVKHTAERLAELLA